MDRHTALIGFQQEGSFRHIPQCIRVIMFAEREVKPLPYEALRQFLLSPKAVDNPRLGRMNFFFQGNQFIISLYGMDNQRQAGSVRKEKLSCGKLPLARKKAHGNTYQAPLLPKQSPACLFPTQILSTGAASDNSRK